MGFRLAAPWRPRRDLPWQALRTAWYYGVNCYRVALEHIAAHTKDRDTVDVALQALTDGRGLPLWEPQLWDRAHDRNRILTIAVFAEILAKVGQKESHLDSQS